MNVTQFNRNAWNFQSMEGCRWSTPVEPDVIEQALKGNWQVLLTPNKTVPSPWLGEVKNFDLLCLASGGGQQAPLFAAAGAKVTSFDNSDVQLEKDQLVADRHQLEITTMQGDMADLSAFDDACFDLIFHPVSNVFAPDIHPIWRECFRVLKPGGSLLSGFMNPAFFLFDHVHGEETGELIVKYPLPYSDLDSLTEDQLDDQIEATLSLEYSHSLQDQIGGQTQAGFMIADLYEDSWDDQSTALNPYMPTFLATRAIKN
ncbi:MAG: class I SAM-dependent methyltransferase [Verrucomicrobiales bacterium]|nr:class I SAM-dependent methyltransferase [Verrucomicrobiales bacterium]